MRKSTVLALLMIVSIIALSITACSKQDRIGLVKTFEAAYNNHDVEDALALLAEGTVLEKDIRKFNGLDKIRALARYDSVMNARWTFADLQQKGDSVVFRAVERSEWFRLIGVDEYRYDTCIMTFEGERIKSIRLVSSPITARILGMGLQSVADWASDERLVQLNDLLSSGFTQESAQGWLDILSAWREETKK
ncbi:MAG: nuclear transport factor 2 family protein [Candidatus Zixiibacteriota bacterium]|nr:MAG: nuclear transport factor 2 family protein [candidate division Zixibacteria bacterium]